MKFDQVAHVTRTQHRHIQQSIMASAIHIRQSGKRRKREVNSGGKRSGLRKKQKENAKTKQTCLFATYFILFLLSAFVKLQRARLPLMCPAVEYIFSVCFLFIYIHTHTYIFYPSIDLLFSIFFLFCSLCFVF